MEILNNTVRDQVWNDVIGRTYGLDRPFLLVDRDYLKKLFHEYNFENRKKASTFLEIFYDLDTSFWENSKINYPNRWNQPYVLNIDEINEIFNKIEKENFFSPYLTWLLVNIYLNQSKKHL